jgi:hypothetical protein
VAGVYNIWKQMLAQGAIPWATGSGLKGMLVKDTYTFDPDEANLTTLATHEVTAVTGYTGGFGGSGRHTLDNLVVNLDNVNNRAKLDADDEAWATFETTEANRPKSVVVVYETGGADSASIPCAYLDIASPMTPNGGTFTFVWDAVGLITLT